MVENPVPALERLVKLHRSGELTDAEFAAAKQELINPPAQPPRAAQPPPRRSEPQPAVTPHSTGAVERSPIRTFGISWKLSLLAVLIGGIVLGVALLIVAEVAPSTAQWTKPLVCATKEQLITSGGVVHSNGGSAQGATHFYCVPAGESLNGLQLLSLPEKTGVVLGLSVLLGFGIAIVLTGITIGLLSLRSARQVRWMRQ